MEGLDSLLVFKAFVILAIAFVVYVLVARRTWRNSILAIRLIGSFVRGIPDMVRTALSSEAKRRARVHDRYVRILHGLLLTDRAKSVIAEHRKAGVDQDGKPYTEQDYQAALTRLGAWKEIAVRYFKTLPDEEVDLLSELLCEEKGFLKGEPQDKAKEFLRLEREKIGQNQHKIKGHYERLVGTFPEHFMDS